MWLQELSIPTPGRIIGNSHGEGGVKLNCNFSERLKGLGGGYGHFLE